MPIEDVVSIKGRGTVGTGRVDRGKVHVGDEVAIIGLSKDIRKTVVTGVEMFNKTLDEGKAGDKPQFYFRTTDVTGCVKAIKSREGKAAEMCMPGDNIAMEVEIISPIAMEEGLRFAIREGGRTVGAGVVTKIIG